MVLQFRGRVGTGQQILDGDLRDLQIVTLSSGTYLYATTGAGGGLSAYTLGVGAMAAWENSLYYSGISSELISGDLSVLSQNGTDLLVFGGAGNLQAVQLGADGRIGVRTQTGSLSNGTETITAMATVSLNSGLAVYVTDSGTGALTTYASDGSGLQHQSGGTVPGLADTVALASVTVQGSSFLLAADHATQGVSSFRVNATTGALTPADVMGAMQGLGISAPTAMEVVQAFGATWVILAAAGSSSLSVMQVSATGELIAADHVIDTLHTRFGGVQSLAVVETGGQVFIVAGGADDGLSLFTLLPDGRLVHLETLVHWDGLGLMDVSQIAAQQIGTEIQIFVTSDDAAGLSQFRISLADLGQVLTDTGTTTLTGGVGDDLIIARGNETLQGAGGNDILVAGTDGTVMTGGAGADLFVMTAGGHTVTITDFDPANDRLDLSDWPMLRDPAQLTLTPTRSGAIITYRDNTLVIQTAAGQPLNGIGAHFDGPDRVLVLGQPVGRSLIGSRGNDTLFGDDGNDTIDAGGGHDRVVARAGDDLLYAGWGHDYVEAGTGNDTIWAAGGDDTIYGNAGDDVIGGGDGTDMLWGGDGDDLIFGDAEDDTLGGAAGNDTIWAGDGRDLVFGDLGHDEVYGDIGADQLWAGPGNDLVFGGEGWDSIGGGPGRDTLWADGGNDLVYGGDQDDVIGGGDGQDTIWAGSGNDTIHGGSDDDLMGGGFGMDRLSGGRGNDTLFGGAAADVFIFTDSDGADRIADFTPGEDQIHLFDVGVGFSSLRLTNTVNSTIVDYGSGTIQLMRVAIGDLDSGDFLFN